MKVHEKFIVIEKSVALKFLTESYLSYSFKENTLRGI